MDSIKYIILAAILLIVIFFSGFFTRSCTHECPKSTSQVDTIIVSDIIFQSNIKEVYKKVVDTIYINTIDTLIQNDTIYLYLLKEQKYYEDSLYKAWVSGYQPNLDSISIVKSVEYITKTEYIKNKNKFGIGVQVGAGYNGKFTPYIGIGVQYNLITF